MSNKMLIDASHPEETRVAVVRGNRIEEYDFESQEKKQLKGNIYLAKVMRVEPSLQAAFVDYGGNRHGFLAFSEIHPDYYQIPMADRQALLEDEARQARADREEEEAADDDEVEALSQADEEDGDETDEPAKPRARTRRRNTSRRSRKAKSEAEDSDTDDSQDSQDEGTNKEGDEGANDATADTDTISNTDDDGDQDGDKTRTIAASVEIDEISEPLPDGEEEEADTTNAPSDNDEVEEKPKPRRAPRAKKATTEEENSSNEADEKPKRTRRKKVAAEAQEENDAKTDEEESKPKRRRTSRAKKKPEEEATVEASETSNPEPANEDTAEEEAKPKRRSRRTSRAKSKDTDANETSSEDKADNDDSNGNESTDNDNDGELKAKPKPRRRRSRKSGDDAEQGEADTKQDVESVGQEDALEEVPAPRRSRRQYKIQEVIKRRQILLVQVVKEERGTKGAALTTYLSLAGRYSVLMPNTARGGGISRKITNASDRSRLKAIANGLEVPEGMGVILRTAGASRTKADIERDFDYLMRLWEKVRNLTLSSSAPCLVYEEGSLIKRSIRDLYDREMGEVIVSGEDGYKEARDFMAMLMPNHAKKVKAFKDDRQSLFTRYGVETHLEKMLSPQVTLKSGGYLVINQTEALVAVDVNSGRATREHSIEETALNTNLEAAEEVSRQLRLRDLAGLIVIDFIDMEEKRNNRAVEKKVKDCLKHDRARIQVGRISHFGLLEMSRQRMRASVLESTMDTCSNCGGTGYVRSASAIALHIIRSIEEHVAKHSRNDCHVKATTAIAIYLLNHKRSALAEIEDRLGLKILVEVDTSLDGQDFKVEKGAQASGEPRQNAAISPQGKTDNEEPDAPEEETGLEAADKESFNEDDEEDRERKRRRRGKRGGRRRGRRDQEEGFEAAHDNDTTKANKVEEHAQSSEAKSAEDNLDAGDSPQEKPARRTSRRKKTDDVLKVEDNTSASSTHSQQDTESDDQEDHQNSNANRRTTRRGKGTTAPAPMRELSSELSASEDETSESVNGQGENTDQAIQSPRRTTRRTTRRKDNGASKVQATDTDKHEVEAVAEPEPQAKASETAESKAKEKSKRKGWWSRGAGFFS